jgi:hypothetical protein
MTFQTTSFLRSDGAPGDVILTGLQEVPLSLAPARSGFRLLSDAYAPPRSFARVLGPDGSESAALCSEIRSTEPVQTIEPNPLGGYVEGMSTYDPDIGDTLWLRWVDDTLHPSGDWHPVVTWRAWNLNHSWALYVDEQGKALVLSFFYLPGFGAPAPPSTWTFSAQWMGPDGPLGDRFDPIAPIYTPPPSGGFVLFAQWGSAVPLPGGGFAMFHDGEVGSAGGSISPKGWYAAYSSTAVSIPVPDWVKPYDGSLHPLAGGRGYEATRRDPVTCARTALLVSPAGTTCFTLPLEASDLCTFGTDVIAGDGTIALHNGCEFRWWPGLARPAP